MRFSRHGFTFVEVMIAVVLVGAIGGALLMGMYNASTGQQASSSKQAAAYLFDYLASQVTNGNPRYTPPEGGDTITLTSADVSAAFAGQTGATFANSQLFKATVTNVRSLSETIAGAEVRSVEYLISVCWEPVTQATGQDDRSCVEKTVTGPVPSRFAGGSDTSPTESVPVGSGKLVINITAPAGVSGRVLVSGPGFNQTVTESTILEGLAPGDYTVTPQPVSDALYTYEPSMTTSSTNVGAGEGAVVNVHYAAASGAISVSVAHPSDVPNPSIEISSSDPPYAVVVNESTTLPYLSPGTYAISAQPITTERYTYDPVVSDTSIVVTAGATSSVTVSYGATTGALEASVSAPDDVSSATVRIIGPNDYQNTVGLGTSLIDNLLEGTYLALPENVVLDGVTYAGQVTPDAGVYVAPGSTASLTVEYAPVDAALTVAVVPEATPADINPTVRVTAPDGSTQTLRGLATHTLTSLPPGTYTVTADPASDGRFTWEPQPATATVDLTVGQSEAVEVRYGIRSGIVRLHVSGLPGNAGAPVTLTGPGQTYAFGAGSHEINPAEPGSYDLAAETVATDLYTFAPSPAHDRFDVATGAEVTKTITYAASTGALELSSTGLPGDLEARYEVTGPSASGTYAGDRTLVHLIPGAYGIAAKEVADGYAVYLPSPPSVDTTVNAGALSVAAFTYALQTGAINVNVDAPQGSAPSVTLEGPSGPYTISTPGTTGFSDVVPGVYSVHAEPLVVDHVRYVPEHPNTVEVRSGQTASVAVAYNATTAAIEVRIASPVGEASVTVTGPGSYVRTVTENTVLDGLEPGTYTFTPAAVTADGDRYEAPSIQVDVAVGDYAFADIAYHRVTAHLNVAVAGLPADVPARVTVTGPNGFSQTVTSTTLLKGLDSGVYTLSAAPVAANGFTYDPDPESLRIVLPAGGETAVTITYSPTSGVIRLVTKAPEDLSYTVRLSGPGDASLSYSGQGDGGTVFSDQPLGDYAVAAAPATSGLITYDPEITPATFTLEGAHTQTVTVRYAASTAALQVNVTGLPSEADAAVTVTGPGGYRRTLTASAVLEGLEPGTYVMTATPVATGIVRYDPVPSDASLTLAAGEIGTFDIAYTAVPASLRLTVDGLPADADPVITLAGPDGFTDAVSGSHTWTSLTPGQYTLSAQPVTVSPFTYTPSPATQNLTLASGRTATTTITYGTDHGQLLVEVSGYTNAPYEITGPDGYQQTFTGSQSLLLAPGTYTIHAPDFQAPDGHVYRSTQPQFDVTVTAGQTSRAAFAYYQYTAELRVTVTDVPSGLTPDVHVYNDTTNKTLTGADVTFRLPPGTYTVVASDLTSGNQTYKSTSVAVTLDSGDAQTATLAYYQYTATLDVSVTGAPATPTVTVTSNDTSSSKVGTHLTFYLPPGTYTLSGNRLSYDGFYYETNPRTVTLTAGNTLFTSLAYGPITGKARVYNTGSRSGYPAISLQGPGGYSSTVPAGSNPAYRNYLYPGTYSLAYTSPYYINSVRRFVARNTIDSANVAAGQTSMLKVFWQYQEWTCTLRFIVCLRWDWVDK